MKQLTDKKNREKKTSTTESAGVMWRPGCVFDPPAYTRQASADSYLVEGYRVLQDTNGGHDPFVTLRVMTIFIYISMCYVNRLKHSSIYTGAINL